MGHLKAEPGATTDERRKKQCIGAKHGAKEFLSLYGGAGFGRACQEYHLH
jgi:hypothetical protein